jgi:hypothetical protein
MKKVLGVIALSVAMVGCSSTATKKSEVIPSPTPAVTQPQTVAAPGKIDVPKTIDIPPWYIKAPDSTDEYVFVTGTAASTDLAMSRAKAMLDAQYQLASKINGMIDAVMRQSKKDNSGTVGTDYTSLTIKKTIEQTYLTGYHLEDTRIQPENRGYRTFVLIRYPLGDANQLLREKNLRTFQQQSLDATIDKELGKSSVMPVIVSPVADARPTEIKLLDVDNAEYKKRRDEALQKPGAVIGQTTLR